MFEPVLRGKVHVVLAGELWSAVCVADAWNAKPCKVSLSFVGVFKVIHFNPVRKMAQYYKAGFLSVNEDGSAEIGSDRKCSFVNFDPYCAQVLKSLHMIVCLFPGQNSTSRPMRAFGSGPKWFAWVLSSISACMDYGIINCAPL